MAFSPIGTITQTWRLGIMQGGLSAVYFGVNAFLHDCARRSPEQIGRVDRNQRRAVAGFVSSAPGSPEYAVGRRSPLVMAGVAALIGLAGVSHR
jgi:hypothetical protein